jgi:hypothetical protein
MKEKVMFRIASSAVLLAVTLTAAGCGEGMPDTPLVSEAVAAPAAQGPDYGWKTNAHPTEDGTVVDYE